MSASGSFVLCLHAEGGTHIELVHKASHEEDASCSDSETFLDEQECPPCTDFLLKSSDLPLVRPFYGDLVKSPIPVLSHEAELISVAELYSEEHMSILQPTRGPPSVEPVSNLIRRIVVMRL